MIIIIPIGGLGIRFKDNGYNTPKALINVFGKPIIYYLLDNLNLKEVDFVYIPYNKEYQKYNFEDRLTKDYPHIKFIFYCLEQNTRGAAETINIALNNLNNHEDIPVLCLDSDNFYLCDIIKEWKGNNCVFSINNTNAAPIYSYIVCNEYNCIIDMKEKEKISDLACTGAYGFESIHLLKNYTAKIIESNKKQQSEFYMSGVIKEMIDDNYKFANNTLNNSDFICLGTPIQLKLFYNNFPKINCNNNKTLIQSKRICFDLDNTLVSFPKIANDYTSVEPINKNIQLLRYLKKFDNTIIIYTARRMKTHNGNVGKINSDVGKITFDTLDKFNIPYDEIYFGKPHADFYIDDLAINCFDDIEKELGFYNNTIEPRYFNTIENTNIDIIIKKGENLSGEIYYYNNIPVEIKDLFPIFFNSENENNIFRIEKINGLTATELYLSELLSEDNLKHILNSIVRIQNCNYNTNDEINIYNNYKNKIIERYNTYDYSKFEDSENIYNDLIQNLNNYESNNTGMKTIIHGDPVFTNIFINNYGKIKFIDMRGKQGEILTICGDWLYDWAKIYQSLIGYDEILLSKKVSNTYKQKMIVYFEKYFINKYSENDFNNLKIITKSLLFSLIPLHDNDNCHDFYKLIYSEYLN